MKKGTSSDDCLPKFFKVYLPDESGDDLEIPVSFNSFLPKSLPKNVTVRSVYGKVWKLELRKRCGDVEKFVMVDGWKRIVKDEEFKGGEFLAFEFDGSRLFNFCIYDHTTCKRLGNSVKTNAMEDESDGDDDIIVIDDDDQDSGDDDYDDDVEAADGDDDIIVIDDDDQDSGDDDEDDDNDDDVEAADGDDDVEADDDDDGVDAEASDFDDDDDDDVEADDDQRQYLDDRDNPSFTVTLNPKKKSQLLIPAHVIKDYNLIFPELITIVDPLSTKFGTLEKKIKVQDNGSVFIKGFGGIFRRNSVKTTDKMICEVKKSAGNLVNTIKIHIIRG